MPAYAAARTISPRLHSYFARQREEALCRGRDCRLASVPDAGAIEAIIDAVFWTSLRREEGYSPLISLALLAPHETRNALLFERPLALEPGALARVARAVEKPGIHFGVWRADDAFCVWGITRDIPVLCFVLEVAAPGLLVVKHYRGEESRKFANVAVLEGDQIKLVEQRPSGRPEPPPLLKSLLGFDNAASGPRSVITMVQLALSMRAHGHGGLLLVVPAGSETWRESIVQPLPYTASPPFGEIACLNTPSHGPNEPRAWQEALASAVDSVCGLTAVDGAVVLNSRYELLGFGAQIARRHGWPRVEQLLLTEPIEAAAPVVVQPQQLGGTRHSAAAQFVHDQRDGVALVASQDGRFTVFEWSRDDEKVRAHRIESLLL